MRYFGKTFDGSNKVMTGRIGENQTVAKSIHNIMLALYNISPFSDQIKQ